MGIPEYSLYKLLSESKRELHANIRMLWADPEVHFIVLFQDPEGEKAILTVGPGLDYGSLEEVQDVEIDGMKPTAFVRGRHCPKQQQQAIQAAGTKRSKGLTSVPFPWETKTSKAPFSKAPFSRGDSQPGISPDEAERLKKEEARLKKLAEQLREKEVDLRNLEEELNAREAFITESENRLSIKGEELLEREAELAQMEENLKGREAARER